MTASSPCTIDHLVVTAPSLDVGVKWVEKQLGVELQPGGEHPSMGTHNCLLRLGESTYLEVIAPNPAAARPPRPRWFGLDRLTPNSAPRLASWVARTADIQAGFSTSSQDLGTILTMRRGDLEWRITVPDDGNVILGGIIPMLIEWKTPAHPASRLPDSGCTLLRLEGITQDEKLAIAALDSIRAAKLLSLIPAGAIALPGLNAHILTPHGPKVLNRARRQNYSR
jgi:Glyoxalase-like domain